MTTLFRQRTTLTGFPGGPGVATMYFLDASTAIESVSAMWTSLTYHMPAGVTATPERTGDKIEDTTGALVGSWIGGVSTPSTAGTAGAYSAPSGAVITWLTDTILDGHRLRGRTFVVPLAATEYQNDGSIATASLTLFRSITAQFILEQSASAVVWHRPFKGRPAIGTRPARPAHPGGHGLITASRVPDLSAVLRSRRD